MPKTALYPILGFTLIELLVAISIVSILSLVGLFNLRGFKPDQDLRSAALSLQTLLQEARSNAKNGLTCDNVDANDWRVKIDDGQGSATLLCTRFSDGSLISLKTLTFFSTITVDDLGDPDCTSYEVKYQKSTDDLEFVGFPSLSCPSNITTLNITFKNSVNNSTKTMTVNKGGTIYVPK